MTSCKIDECTKDTWAKGWCGTHYRRWQRYGDPLFVKQVKQRNPDECTVDDCHDEPYGKGLCNKHWQRMRKTGDPTVVKQRTANAGSFKPGQAAHNKGVPMTEETKRKISEAKRGQVPYNKGVPRPPEWNNPLRGINRSEETRAKIRAARALQEITDEHRAAISAGLAGRELAPDHVAKISGPNNYRWKGGGSRNLSAKEWITVRDACYERDEYTCTKCGATEDLVAHHIVYERDGGPDELENLTTLCRACHARAHAHDHLVDIDLDQ
jgi:hypothetical protein